MDENHQVPSMMSAVEVEMAGRIERSRENLLDLLRGDERRTTRSHGSQYSRTFEDAARDVARDDDDPRAWAVALALVNYQGAVNALWEWAIEDGIVDALAKRWMSKRWSFFNEVVATYDRNASQDAITLMKEEVIAEATWAARRAASFYGSGRNRFAVYAYKPIFQGLDLWLTRLRCPVEIPEKVARSGDAPKRVPLEEYTDVWEKE